MLVIADTSPLIVLVNIGHLEILPKLFGRIVIPSAVAGELADPARPQAVRDLLATRPHWLEVQQPKVVQFIPELHPGETEAISLAIELHADLLLIDERKAYHEAIARHINAIGTIRVLERAAAEGLLELGEAFDRVKRTDFWISHRLLDERLKMFRRGKRP